MNDVMRDLFRCTGTVDNCLLYLLLLVNLAGSCWNQNLSYSQWEFRFY
jgi:hypothetical protein